MEFRPLDVTVISAKDLKDCQLIGKQDVYAVVSINGDYRTQQRTPVDKDCGTKPKWNHNTKFTLDLAAAQQNRLSLVLQLIADRSIGDKVIGEVTVPIKELLDHDNTSGEVENVVSYNVRLPNGKSKGTLNFSYRFGEKFEMASQPPQQPPMMMSYPPSGYPGGQGQPAGYPGGQGGYPGGQGGYPGGQGGYPGGQGGYPGGQGSPIAHPGGQGSPIAHPGGQGPPTGCTGDQGPPSPKSKSKDENNQGPVMAYPPSGYNGYPPNQPPNPYGYPPQNGYQPQPSHGYGGYPPQQSPGYGGYPPQQGYGYPGYPPQQVGQYGQPPFMQQAKPQKQKKKKSGGMGLGLGAGLLGGLLVGDMMGDVAEASFDGDMDF